MSVGFQDYYEVLGVPRDVGSDEIRRAYRKLARQYHPDINHDSDGEERFKESDTDGGFRGRVPLSWDACARRPARSRDCDR
jgi:DnaJ domain